MSLRKLSKSFIGGILIILVLVGCGSPAATSVSLTPKPFLPTSTLTLVPSTKTPIPLTPTPIFEGITVTGRVTNLEVAKTYLSNDSYLQLLLVPPDGQLSGGTDEQGRMFYESELAKSTISSTGVFRLQAEDLNPGRYLVVIQMLQPGWYSGYPFLIKVDEYLTIEIQQDVDLPLVIDIGDVEMPKPKQ